MTTDAANLTPETSIHKFERAGLGLAPYKFLGMTEEKYCAGPGAPIQPGGSCDYCGTGIVNVCHLKSADGRTFKVGTDCVLKAGDAGLVRLVDRAQRNHNRKVVADRNERKAAALAMALAHEPTRAILAALPRPSGTRGSFLDYAEWMAVNAGAAGRARILKTIEGVQ